MIEVVVWTLLEVLKDQMACLGLAVGTFQIATTSLAARAANRVARRFIRLFWERALAHKPFVLLTFLLSHGTDVGTVVGLVVGKLASLSKRATNVHAKLFVAQSANWYV